MFRLCESVWYSHNIKTTVDYVAFSTGVHIYWASGRLRNQILFGGAQYLWVLSVGLASFGPPGTRGVGMVSRILGSSCTPVLLTFCVVMFRIPEGWREIGLRDTCPVTFA